MKRSPDKQCGRRLRTGRPFAQRVRRLEYRSLHIDVARLIRDLVENRFDVLVTGASDGEGPALFRSNVLPHHPECDPDAFPEIIQRCHEHDIMVQAWTYYCIEYFGNPNGFLPVKWHPEWAMKFINPPADGKIDAVGMCVTSSPWRETIARFIREVAKMGVDALWFDGTGMTGLPNNERIGCVCEHCGAAFREDTDFALPTAIDWEDPVFRRWVAWRYDRFMATADHFTGVIHEVDPGIEVVFSTANRPGPPPGWELSWGYAVPMRRFTSFGSSEHSGLGPTNAVQMMGFHCKLARAHNQEIADLWTPLTSTRLNHFTPYLPVDRMMHHMHALGCIAHGVAPWYGLGYIDRFELMRKINDAVAKREEAFGGTELGYCAVHLSQITRDFYGLRHGRLKDYSSGLFGLYSMLTQEHIPFSFVFDDDLCEDRLKDFAVLVLPNSACLSQAMHERIRAFLGRGGLVIAWHQTGKLDEWGDRAPTPLAQHLISLRVGPAVSDEPRVFDRAFRLRPGVLEELPRLLELDGPWSGLEWDGRNPIDVWGSILDRTGAPTSAPALVAGSVPDGQVIWCEADLGQAYFLWPHVHTRKLLRSLVALRPALVRIDAPAVVLANCLVGPDGSTVRVHLLNLPFCSNRVAGTVQRTTLDELVPIHDVKVSIRDSRVRSARAVAAGANLSMARDGDRLEVSLPVLHDHEVIEFGA
ncbi:MAG: alpha-amylase family protein [Planctomycetota bacterium]